MLKNCHKDEFFYDYCKKAYNRRKAYSFNG